MEQETISIYEKKGEVRGSVGAIVYLITGVGVGILVLIFVGTLGGSTYELVESDINEIGNHAVTAEAFTGATNVTHSLGNGLIQSGTLTIQNATGGYQIVGLGNFTVDYSAGTIYLTAASYNTSSLYANYTWGNITVQNSIKGGIISSFEALENTGDYLPIIVLAVVISIVLTLVLGMGMLTSTRSGGGSAL